MIEPKRVYYLNENCIQCGKIVGLDLDESDVNGDMSFLDIDTENENEMNLWLSIARRTKLRPDFYRDTIRRALDYINVEWRE